MDDSRGKEHIKLSTEYSGKSQLNLGHLVDAQRQQRGEGFELRTDGWGAIRSGKGLFISADEQNRASGQVLAMQPAESLLKGAVNQMEAWAETAQSHHNPAPERKSLRRLRDEATQLKAPALLLSAPNGIGAVSPQTILLDSAQALYLQSAGEVNLASEDRLHANSRQAMTLLAQEEGMRLVSGKGPLNLESHADTLSLIAQQDVTVQSTQGHLQITAKQGITLASGGAYIRLSPDGKIEVHGPTLLSLKGQHRLTPPISQDFPLPELPTSVCKECLKKAQAIAAGFAQREA
jgi:type VI secretion system secreted protein VgrG